LPILLTQDPLGHQFHHVFLPLFQGLDPTDGYNHRFFHGYTARSFFRCCLRKASYYTRFPAGCKVSLAPSQGPPAEKTPAGGADFVEICPFPPLTIVPGNTI